MSCGGVGDDGGGVGGRVGMSGMPLTQCKSIIVVSLSFKGKHPEAKFIFLEGLLHSLPVDLHP